MTRKNKRLDSSRGSSPINPDTLKNVGEGAAPPEVDGLVKMESDDFERAAAAANAHLDFAEREHQLAKFQEEHHARLRFANKIYNMVVVWLGVVLILVFLDGEHSSKCPFSFDLSDTVVLALLGSTTVNVVGLFYTVVGYFYKNEKKNKKNGTKSDNKEK